jgi:P27 family predicted phage terminase small subunit
MPAKKSKSSKIIQGNFLPCRDQEGDPYFPNLTTPPPAPDGLNEWGKALWVKICPQLIESGLLTTVDTLALELLCISYGFAMDLLEAMTVQKIKGKNGKIKKLRVPITSYLEGKNSQTNTLYAAYKSELQFVDKGLAQFGLTPRARNHIEIPPKNEPLDEYDLTALRLIYDKE